MGFVRVADCCSRFAVLSHFFVVELQVEYCCCRPLHQGYPQALLPLTVAGIPSIHICLDFIPELLAQPQLEKQVRPPNVSSSLFSG